MFLASRERIGKLQRDFPPIVIEKELHTITMPFPAHDIVFPFAVERIGIGLERHDIVAMLIEHRTLDESVLQDMLPSGFVMFRDAWRKTGKTRHAEIGRQRQFIDAQIMIELLHLGGSEIDEIVVVEEIFERETRLKTVIVAAVVGNIGHKVDSELREQLVRNSNFVVIIIGELRHGNIARVRSDGVIEKKQLVDVARSADACRNRIYIINMKNIITKEPITDTEPLEKEESIIMTMEDFIEDFDA